MYKRQAVACAWRTAKRSCGAVVCAWRTAKRSCGAVACVWLSLIHIYLTPEEEGGRIANLFRRYRKLRRIFREIHADVVLSTIGKNNFMALLANAFLPTKVVVSVVAEPTEEYPTKGMRLLAKTLFYAADGIVMQTADAVRFFQPSLQKKCVILKNSLNPAFVRPRYEDDRPQDIVAVGRMDENKNQRMAIRAFCKIAERFPDARLILYGDCLLYTSCPTPTISGATAILMKPISPAMIRCRF